MNFPPVFNFNANIHNPYVNLKKPFVIFVIFVL